MSCASDEKRETERDNFLIVKDSVIAQMKDMTVVMIDSHQYENTEARL